MITIVSGLPRSGTSLMMQMLEAGGLPVLSDGERKADTDNPKGYLEWERIKQLPKEPGLIVEAEGKVVKVISQLILALHEYDPIFVSFGQRQDQLRNDLHYFAFRLCDQTRVFRKLLDPFPLQIPFWIISIRFALAITEHSKSARLEHLHHQ